MWRGCVITWDGLVVPCCFDKDADHRMGDLKEQSFGEIWRGSEYKNFRQKLFTARKEIDICRNCTEK
jgi:radical SAM protein with 4Fe4S-binding SPASM domain